MVENENETMRDRVSDLEKRVHDQNDEITCLRATLADALRRINTLEAGKGKKNYNLVVIGGGMKSFSKCNFGKPKFLFQRQDLSI